MCISKIKAYRFLFLLRRGLTIVEVCRPHTLVCRIEIFVTTKPHVQFERKYLRAYAGIVQVDYSFSLLHGQLRFTDSSSYDNLSIWNSCITGKRIVHLVF